MSDLTTSSRSNDFEVDILDMIDVRGGLAMLDIIKMIKLSLPPTEIYPDSTAEVLSPQGLQFRVEGMTKLSSFNQTFNEFPHLVESSHEDPFQTVKIFIFKPKHLISSGKFIEHHLTRDKSGEMWIYEMPDVTLNLHDTIEYWIYAEKSNLGYFSQHILAVQGKIFIMRCVSKSSKLRVDEIIKFVVERGCAKR